MVFFLQIEKKSNNDTFTPIISETDDISKKLDNNELIDPLFDKKMIIFKQNYTNIIKDMEKEKCKNFILEEDILKDNFFENKVEIEKRMKDLLSEVVKKIKE